ncbi:serine hydrolase [Microcystis panniformis]|uniref:serine hydrolase n=1 Tax=Microcystis panniformis TaxID=513223 RepID=UPI0025415E97|nr:serine hydrolase [Microcystis panniformis]
MLVAENKLEENKLVRDYIPELTKSGFGDATVRQVLDMTTALDYSEDYADPRRGSGNTRPPGILYRNQKVILAPALIFNSCKLSKKKENTVRVLAIKLLILMFLVG